jgi:ketosteroid isomerase-like protein
MTDPQTSVEVQIRNLEARHVEAMLARDEATLSTLWSPSMIVNAPNNTVSDGPGTLQAMRAGFVHYHAYEQTIESVKIFGDTAIVMGQETVTPVMGPDANKPVQRRFLDVWQRTEDRWLQIARQASIILTA